MTAQQRTVVWRAPRETRVEARPVASVVPGAAVVSVASVGICGTDLAVWRGDRRIDTGVVLGHEAGGVVIEVGDGVDARLVGTAVAIDPNVTCGSCAVCRTGSRGMCAQRRLMGVDLDGLLAETVAVPASQLVLVPGLADPRAAALVEPLAVGIHAAARGGVGRGHDVVVVGGGPIGAASAVGAERRGAGSVTLVEPSAERREALADAGFRAVHPDATLETHADVVIDAVGIGATLASAVRMVRDAGTVCVVGLSHAAPPSLYAVPRRELTVVGSFCYTHDDLRDAAGVVAERGIGTLPARLVDGIDAVPSTLSALAAGDVGRGKTLVVPHP